MIYPIVALLFWSPIWFLLDLYTNKLDNDCNEYWFKPVWMGGAIIAVILILLVIILPLISNIVIEKLLYGQ